LTIYKEPLPPNSRVPEGSDHRMSRGVKPGSPRSQKEQSRLGLQLSGTDLEHPSDGLHICTAQKEPVVNLLPTVEESHRAHVDGLFDECLRVGWDAQPATA